MVSQVLVSFNEEGIARSMVGSLVFSVVLFSAVWHDRAEVMDWAMWGDWGKTRGKTN